MKPRIWITKTGCISTREFIDQVRALDISVVAIAAQFDCTNMAVYGWIKVNRLPMRKYVEMLDFCEDKKLDFPRHLFQPERHAENKPKQKESNHE